MVVGARVSLNQRAIARHTQRGGDIWEMVNFEILPVAQRSAKRRAPIGTGNLSRAIYTDIDEGPRGVTGILGIDDDIAPYGKVVVDGYAPDITNGGQPMPVGASSLARGIPQGLVNRRPGKAIKGEFRLFAKRVRGQAPNDFLQRALNDAVEAHGLTRFVI